MHHCQSNGAGRVGAFLTISFTLICFSLMSRMFLTQNQKITDDSGDELLECGYQPYQKVTVIVIHAQNIVFHIIIICKGK